MVGEETISKESETERNKEGGTVDDETNTPLNLVTEEMVAAAGFNIKSPIVNAIIQNLTNLLPEKKGQNTEYSQKKCCPVCNVSCMNSESDRVSHILGKKHYNKMWSLRIQKNLKRICKRRDVQKPPKGDYKCHQCKVTVNSPIQLVYHMRSKKHNRTKTKSGIVLSANEMNDLSHPTVTYFCQHCIVHFTSKKQMLQHRASLIHQINLERNKRV